MKYSILKGIKKGVQVLILFLIPALIDDFIIAYPQIAQLTVGGLLVMGVNYLKIKFSLKLL